MSETPRQQIHETDEAALTIPELEELILRARNQEHMDLMVAASAARNRQENPPEGASPEELARAREEAHAAKLKLLHFQLNGYRHAQPPEGFDKT